MSDLEDLYSTINQAQRAREVQALLAQAQRGLSRTLAEYREQARFSLARMVQELAAGGLRDGIERELCEQAAAAAGQTHDPHRPVVPWSVLSRDLTVASASGGGYLAGDVGVPFVVDVLRPFSVTARMGVTMLPGQTASFSLPRGTAAASASWLATEATGIAESTPALGAVAFAPKMSGAYTELSRQLLKQAPNLADRYVRDQLMRTTGTVIDQAVLNGTGASGQPTGVLNTVGIGAQSGTSLAWAGVLNMLETLATAKANDVAIRFLATPAVRELLQAREAISTSGRFIWDNDRVVNREAFVTTDMPAATMLAGDWSQVLVPMWGPGLVVELNPYASFPAGIVGARVLVGMDAGVMTPAAFIAATSIT